MKLLISAYACAPHHGSEHAVGWNWTTEAHRLGHEVWVLASSVHRDAIKAACREDPELDGIHWSFPEVRCWPLQPGVEPRRERTYNLLWQRAALSHARELQSRVKFDAVHHLTWCGVRAPTFLGSLGPPLIVGPFGGGETCPTLLRDGFDLKGKITEKIRDLSNATITFNPIVRSGLIKLTAIFGQNTRHASDLVSSNAKEGNHLLRPGAETSRGSGTADFSPGSIKTIVCRSIDLLEGGCIVPSWRLRTYYAESLMRSLR
jgi:hypothetical protein